MIAKHMQACVECEDNMGGECRISFCFDLCINDASFETAEGGCRMNVTITVKWKTNTGRCSCRADAAAVSARTGLQECEMRL